MQTSFCRICQNNLPTENFKTSLRRCTKCIYKIKTEHNREYMKQYYIDHRQEILKHQSDFYEFCKKPENEKKKKSIFKNPTNYNNTVIYKAQCINEDIIGFYIGSTTDFYHRVRHHKSDFYNENKSISLKFYKFIKENGGWDNFKFEIIEKYPCNNNKEKIIRESYWINILKPILNTYKTALYDNNILKKT
jgi:predicted GIY-YIG superfamily endonuclease